MSTTSGNGGKQSAFLSAVTSLFPGKKSTNGNNSKSVGGTRGATNSTNSTDTLPRSFGMNRTSSDRSVVDGTRTKPAEPARRSSESALAEPRREPSQGTTAVAPKATVGLKAGAGAPMEDPTASLYAGESTDIELGFPALLIIRYWKEKEDRKFDSRMKDTADPPPDYAPHRRYMVDWISEVGEQLDLQTVTIHSAVSFLDELMVLMNYSHRDWRLYAVCCLSVAAKYEEAECNMPMISELADATEMSLTTPIVTRGELELVQRLQWDVSRVTAMHFLGYYTSQGVTMPDDTCQGRRLVAKVVTYMKKYVDFFANLCQQDYQFQRYRPSHIAAAAVLAARRALCIMPVWREELTELTGYDLADIVECGEELWNFYEKMFPTHKPLRTDPNATAAAVALKKAEQQQQQLAVAAAASSHAGQEAAPASGSDYRVGSSNAADGTRFFA